MFAQGSNYQSFYVNNGENTSSSLDIKTNHQDAKVYLDYQYKGKSDIVLKNLTPGVHKLLIEKKSFESLELRIELKSGQTLNIFAELENLQGTVIFDLIPNIDAVFYIDENIAEKESSVNEGKHKYRICIDGFDDITGEITVKRNEKNIISQTITSEKPFIIGLRLEESHEKILIDYVSNRNTEISIFSKDGNIVFSKQFYTENEHSKVTFIWDKKDFNGSTVKSGDYTFAIKTKSEDDDVQKEMIHHVKSYSETDKNRIIHEKGDMIFSFDISSVFDFNSRDIFQTAPLKIGFEYCPFDFLLLGTNLKFAVNISKDTSYEINGFVKPFFTYRNFIFAAEIEYSYINNPKKYFFDLPGLDIKLESGIFNENILLMFSTSILLGNEEGLFKNFSASWKNSFDIHFMIDKTRMNILISECNFSRYSFLVKLQQPLSDEDIFLNIETGLQTDFNGFLNIKSALGFFIFF